jgi:hypothetical protein
MAPELARENVEMLARLIRHFIQADRRRRPRPPAQLELLEAATLVCRLYAWLEPGFSEAGCPPGCLGCMNQEARHLAALRLRRAVTDGQRGLRKCADT